MPGRRLNDQERALDKLWKNSEKQTRPYLHSIEIDGGTGLRGINGVIIPFRYPITAICGNNGVGKSTILALAALAYHSPENWFIQFGDTQANQKDSNRTYYTFQSFFVNGPTDPLIEGVSITWRHHYQGAEHTVKFTKSADRWGHYSRRLEREVDFLPLGRVVAAYEMNSIRSAFTVDLASTNTNPLEKEYIDYLSYIIGKNYEKAELQKNKKYNFQRCNSGISYTAFNMGGGESCVIAMLYLLQRMPKDGLIVIEEIESGLHPQAQKRMAEVLIEICLRKRLQIICSTHSEAFIDALPRQARLLIQRSGNDHSVIETPSTRFAMYEMTGETKPELIIYCEDVAAAILIEESLPHHMRIRVKIQDVGSNVSVIRQGVGHIRSGHPMNVLCVLDGDCSEADIKSWRKSEGAEKLDKNFDHLTLPGYPLPPEKWLLEQLKIEDYEKEFAKNFLCGSFDAKGHINAIDIQLDHHDIGYILYQRTNISKEDCLRRAIRSVALLHPQLDDLREKIKTMLS